MKRLRYKVLMPWYEMDPCDSSTILTSVLSTVTAFS
eukprot:CAMPEP_0170439414 /NCGR_PEP_ID=MMETSP0117_2-20130122/45764_1 /TAXON_ID=400756 /ORGANISM="Durinskia baltica, Strain CSIRO CS-38" /LENGTH=35 /DNA_ID= /DNA_START= /DNA_END= /DNA_ORIENTATION=